jgi:hypothetical protein
MTASYIGKAVSQVVRIQLKLKLDKDDTQRHANFVVIFNRSTFERNADTY